MKAEDFRTDKKRPFTGAEYLASLRDGREVYINGERVDDVTTHPSMRNSARSLARLYDALHDPAKRDILTAATDTGNGGYTHKFFRHARSVDDLVGQQAAMTEWARMSYGWMGREWTKHGGHAARFLFATVSRPSRTAALVTATR